MFATILTMLFVTILTVVMFLPYNTHSDHVYIGSDYACDNTACQINDSDVCQAVDSTVT